VLGQGDLTLLGAFVPATRGGETPDQFGHSGAYTNTYTGLTLRRLSGTPTLFSISAEGYLVEYAIPSDGNLLTSSPFNSATLVRTWGDIWSTMLSQYPNDALGLASGTGWSNGYRANALFWDDTTSRMYWTTKVGYPSSNNTESDFSLGYSTLDDTGHTGTGIGCWRVSPLSTHGSRWVGQPMRIPDSFAVNTLLNSAMTLGVGFGPNLSIGSYGPKPTGQNLFAMRHPDTTSDPITANPHTSDMTNFYQGPLTPLAKFLYDDPPTMRGDRTPWPVTEYGVDSHALIEGQTGWAAYDYVNGGVWIEGAAKHGIVTFASLMGGNISATIASVASASQFTISKDIPTDAVIVGDIVLVDTIGTQGLSNYPFSLGRVSAISGRTITFQNNGVQSLTKFSGQTLAGGGNDDTSLPLVGGSVMCGVRYMGNGPTAARQINIGQIFDPAQYAQVALGSRASNAVTPAAQWEIQWPDHSSPVQGDVSGTPYHARCDGVAFDPVTKRLYVLIYGNVGITSAVSVLVNVFSVNC
jgi:hypothetical protein